MPRDNDREGLARTDWGLLYGYGLFETLRLYGGVPVLLPEHLDRLLSSAAALEFQHMPSGAELTESVSAFIRAHGLREEAVRLSVTYGNPQEGIRPFVFLSHRSVPYSPEDERAGVAVVLAPTIRDERSPLVHHKSLNQMESVLCGRTAARRGARESLLLNRAGWLTEGSRSNVFLVKGGEVLTPAVECGLLPGIARGLILSRLPSAGVPVRETRLSWGDLESSDECFLTNALMQVLPVVGAEGRAIGRGIPGAVTAVAARIYRDEISRRLRRAGPVSRYF